MKCTAAERFWGMVGNVPLDSECWLWWGSVIDSGYGQFWDGTKQAKAHRFAYELLVGPIPDGLTLDHLCRNRRCVNPAHLEPVSQRTNVLRGVGPSAEQARQTHCIHGHPLSGDNLYLYSSGKRDCRICRRRRSKEQRVRMKQRKAVA